MDSGEIILFQTQGGETKIEVRVANESVWLTADQMAELFQRNRSTIQRHIKKIYDDGELKPDSTCAFFAQVQTEGKRQVERQIPIYNLDMIISVGYRVNSHRGVQWWRYRADGGSRRLSTRWSGEMLAMTKACAICAGVAQNV